MRGFLLGGEVADPRDLVPEQVCDVCAFVVGLAGLSWHSNSREKEDYFYSWKGMVPPFDASDHGWVTPIGGPPTGLDGDSLPSVLNVGELGNENTLSPGDDTTTAGLALAINTILNDAGLVAAQIGDSSWWTVYTDPDETVPTGVYFGSDDAGIETELGLDDDES